MTIGDLLCLCDFLLFEVPMLSTSSSSFVSFLFCFRSIFLSVCLLRVSSIPFFLPVSDYPKDFAEV
ncbi:hypothetical protein HanIR_Chr17g0890721 [Helianthus annuus]|nr:hypothetical protein HanIR_Chr17g0890721 [Helianthus annuus]